MAALYFMSQGIYSNPEISDEGNIWINGPTNEGIILYSIVIPIICAFGIFGNTLSLMVLRRRELKGSIYVYLAVLAFSDLCTSVLTFLSGLSRGILYVDFWPILDAILGLPLAQIFNCLSVQAVIAVMLDRTLHLRNPMVCKKPKYCRSRIARKVMLVAFIVAIIFNLPYFFIFKYENGKLITNPLFYSRYYYLHNWMTFIIFGLLPSIILTAGNIYLIHIVHTFKRIRAKSSVASKSNKKQRDFSNMTITLILIIFFFLITEIPYIIVSRTSGTSFFTDDPENCNSKTLETIREVVTVIFALSLAVDFLLYYLFCPAFYKVLTKIMRKGRKRSRSSIQMNVFVLDGPKQMDEQFKVIKKIIQQNNSSISSSTDDADDYMDDTVTNRKTMETVCNRSSNIPNN